MRRVIVVLILLAGCHPHEADEAPPPPRATPATATTSTTTSSSSNANVAVRGADGKELLTIAEKGGNVEIAFVASDGAKRTLRGDMRESGKRKYSVGDGGVMFEVKPGDDQGFKLRLADGKLHWKVKVAAEKIKVSDNEENKNPFELKVRDGGRFKVVAPGDRELGNVRDGAVEDASGKKMFTFEGKTSAAYGVLLLDSIPEIERYILVAEILSRGR